MSQSHDIMMKVCLAPKVSHRTQYTNKTKAMVTTRQLQEISRSQDLHHLLIYYNYVYLDCSC